MRICCRQRRYGLMAQAKVAAASFDEQKHLAAIMWPKARKTKLFEDGVLAVLSRMAGTRERCMYCEDSRGTDVEHFWPKAVYPTKTFSWPNLLLACVRCQRGKGDRLPLVAGKPLVIDPTVDEPWDYLFFVPETGRITARFDANNVPIAKGGETIRLLKLDDEALNEGRKRAVRNLQGS
jgi:uncharacterized protein (TIGR02646 family)